MMTSPSQQNSSLGAVETPVLAPVKILLVDDSPENLLSAGAVLESLGQEVIKAESAGRRCASCSITISR